MSQDDEQLENRIRERAFQLWQEAGCPEDKAEEFWYRAREAETPPSGETLPPTSDAGNFA